MGWKEAAQIVVDLAPAVIIGGSWMGYVGWRLYRSLEPSRPLSVLSNSNSPQINGPRPATSHL